MSREKEASLCGIHACRRLSGHAGTHNRFAAEAWSFFEERDLKKLSKAGFATPRGGAKGAYQNHVVRSNKVIIPYEHVSAISLKIYKHGYVVRLLPEQYFERRGRPKIGRASCRERVYVLV